MSASLTPGDIIKHCEECVRSWDPSKTTVDSHTSEYIEAFRISDPDDARFVQQVTYGTMRYKKMLKILLSSLYFKHAGETQRSDYTLYMVFGYLALMRLHELGFADFRTLVLSQEHFKMSVLLRFLFSEENLTEWLRPEWLKLYEPNFVDEQLIGKVLVFVSNVDALQKVLAGRMASEAAKKEAAAEAARALAEGRGGSGHHTTPEPFSLTQPKVRLVPPPEDAIETTFHANSVPASTYADPKQLRDRIEIDRLKDANRLEMKAKYANPRKQPFKLRVVERPSNLERVRKEVADAREAECHFDGIRANPIPRQRPGQGVVRLNSAAILREDNLYRKKQETEAALLGAYERELRDSSEFDAWQTKMRSQDEEARLTHIEGRRREAMLADEEAKEARMRKENENRVLAMRLKAEAARALDKKAEEEEALSSHQRALVEHVKEQREKPAQAKLDLAKQHRAQARLLRQEISQLEAAAQAERRREEARRADLIKQIRALELVPRKRETRLDPTYTPQLGLLEEMSLAELRERLLIVEEQRAEDEGNKRASIMQGKQERETDLAQRVSRLKEMRGLAATESAAKREQARAAAREAEAARRERLADGQLKVQAAIESKRAARRDKEAELTAELKKIRIKNQFLEADTDAVERKKWDSQQAGEQREIVQRQRTKQDEAQKGLAVYSKDTAQRLSNLQREREAHEAFVSEYEAHFAASSAEAVAVEASIVDEQRQKLATRRLELEKTKALDAAMQSLPSIAARSSMVSIR